MLERLQLTLQEVEQEAASKKRDLESQRDTDLSRHKSKTDRMMSEHTSVLMAMAK